jgi:uracil phosphoribosyltransferase
MRKGCYPLCFAYLGQKLFILHSPMSVRIVDHPLAQHLLTQLRDSSADTERFRRASQVLCTVLALEATRDLELEGTTVQTPLEQANAKVLKQDLAIVPILRAGLGLLEPYLTFFPSVRVGYIGLERDEETAVARIYYSKLPELRGALSLCLDPMLATGGSAVQAVELMKQHGADDIRLVSVVAAPEGLQHFHEAHPDVPVICVAVDEGLDPRRYIVPGLGDFGDRLFGTA